MVSQEGFNNRLWQELKKKIIVNHAVGMMSILVVVVHPVRKYGNVTYTDQDILKK